MYMYLWILGEGVASSSPTPEPVSDLILDLIFSADMEENTKKICETCHFHSYLGELKAADPKFLQKKQQQKWE